MLSDNNMRGKWKNVSSYKVGSIYYKRLWHLHSIKYIDTHTHTHTHRYIFIYLYMYMCVCLYIYVYIYIYTHTHTHTHTHDVYIYILEAGGEKLSALY